MGELYEGKIMKKMGQDITVDGILPRVVNHFAPEIAHPYPLPPPPPAPYHGSWKHSPSFCSFSLFTVTFGGE